MVVLLLVGGLLLLLVEHVNVSSSSCFSWDDDGAFA